MEFLRQYFWTVLLLVIILVSVVIVTVFIFINICISKRASRYSTKAKANHYGDTNYEKQENQVYRRDPVDEKPPLPSRDQFLPKKSVDQSYEDVSMPPDYVVVEGSTPPSPQKTTFTPQYTTGKTKSEDQESKDYDDVEMPDNYESEDYDDVEMPENCDSEDYDDIG